MVNKRHATRDKERTSDFIDYITFFFFGFIGRDFWLGAIDFGMIGIFLVILSFLYPYTSLVPIWFFFVIFIIFSLGRTSLDTLMYISGV